MENVLIALDYDPTAQMVAEQGYKFARKMNAQVTLLHVISNEVYYASRVYSPIMGFTGFTPAETMEMEQNEYIKEAGYNYLEKTKSHLGDVNIRTMIMEGDFADTIIKTAAAIRADIVVMGTHSRKWLEKIVMGSVTEKVMKELKVPMLIIPTGKDEDN